MDLFAAQRKANEAKAAPLAVRMRPRTLDEVLGQQHFLGPGKLLRRMIEADRLSSAIFYGPPGSGKTTLAKVISDALGDNAARAGGGGTTFEPMNAASANVKDVRRVIDDARARLETSNGRTVLFLDELHRFNRAQQDVLLDEVENGVLILLGATTENPFFAVNSAILSRSQIFEFKPLEEADITQLLHRAIADKERGYGTLQLTVDDAAIEHWARMSDGDARRALTGLEIGVLSQQSQHRPGDSSRQVQSRAPMHIDLSIAEESIQRKAINYDGTGDQHYDTISALIKSMRGSDPDAAVYWLAMMLEAGEDPRFIARRIAIFASEDVGNADPQALTVAASTYHIVTRVGMPECKLTLSQAVLYMATAAKSRASTSALGAATKDVQQQRSLSVPAHLQDAHYAGAAKLNRGGAGEGFGVSKAYYFPADSGAEREVARRLDRINPPSGGEGSDSA